MSALAEALSVLLGDDRVRSGAVVAAMDPGWHPDNLAAGIVVTPHDTGEVARLLAFCDRERIGVVPQGGRTGLVGGAVSRPGEIVLSLGRLDRLLALDPVSRTATVEAGMTLATLQSLAVAKGLDPGIDTAARDSATIGGMISTNAGGIRAFRHGPMRHRLLGIEAVLADGTILSDLGTVLKNTTGYDVKQLLIGSEGTLGVVTAAVVRLEPAPGPRATALLGFDSAADALMLVDRLQRRADADLVAAELMTGGFAAGSARAHGIDPRTLRLGAPIAVIIELAAPTEAAARSALEAVLAEAGDRIRDGVLAENARQRGAIWLVREASDAMPRGYGFAAWDDVSVPLGALDAYLETLDRRARAIDPAFETHAIGHLADGNLHALIARRAALPRPPGAIEAAFHDGLTAIGGAVAAEHGVGLDKRPALARHADPGKLALMRRLKAALDPNAILNPGKVIPPEPRDA